MAFTIKATSPLLIITLVFTSYGVAEAGLWSLIPKAGKTFGKGSGNNWHYTSTTAKGPGKIWDYTPAKGPGKNNLHGPVAKGFPVKTLHPTATTTRRTKAFPVETLHPTAPTTRPPISAEEAAMKKGEALVEKYFGTGAKNGFRVVWKGTKYYIKATKKCEEYHNTLNPNCNSQSVKLWPGCVAKYCIAVAEVLNITVDITPTSCNYYDDCYLPIKALCNGTFRCGFKDIHG